MRILFGLVPKRKRVLLAFFLDAIFYSIVYLIGILVAALWIRGSISAFFAALFVLALPIFLQEPFLMLTGGTFGMTIARIAYVDGATGYRFNHSMYWGFILKVILDERKYIGLYGIDSFFSSEVCQTIGMERTNTYFVLVDAYNVLFDKGIVPFRKD